MNLNKQKARKLRTLKLAHEMSGNPKVQWGRWPTAWWKMAPDTWFPCKKGHSKLRGPEWLANTCRCKGHPHLSWGDHPQGEKWGLNCSHFWYLFKEKKKPTVQANTVGGSHMCGLDMTMARESTSLDLFQLLCFTAEEPRPGPKQFPLRDALIQSMCLFYMPSCPPVPLTQCLIAGYVSLLYHSAYFLSTENALSYVVTGPGTEYGLSRYFLNEHWMETRLLSDSIWFLTSPPLLTCRFVASPQRRFNKAFCPKILEIVSRMDRGY